MIKTATFSYKGKTVTIKNIDPSSPTIPMDRPWEKLSQEIFDQLDDSKQFTKEELAELSEMEDGAFNACIDLTLTVLPNILVSNVLELSFGDNIHEAIKEAQKSEVEYPSKPKKPLLNLKANSAEAKQYAIELEKYEKAIVQYDKQLEIVIDHNRKIEAEIVAYMKEASGFNNTVPKDKQNKVWAKAWSDGHSNGLVSVYTNLTELVDLFS